MDEKKCEACGEEIAQNGEDVGMWATLNGEQVADLHFRCFVAGLVWAAKQAAAVAKEDTECP